MKTTIAIFLMLCLQVAMSPLCLCFGADSRADTAEESDAKASTAKPHCCHTSQDDEPAPCPHCDQEMPISATSPQKGEFSASAPEWHGFDWEAVTDRFDPLHPSSAEVPQHRRARHLKPPPRSFSEVYGVFLI